MSHRWSDDHVAITGMAFEQKELPSRAKRSDLREVPLPRRAIATVRAGHDMIFPDYCSGPVRAPRQVVHVIRKTTTKSPIYRQFEEFVCDRILSMTGDDENFEDDADEERKLWVGFLLLSKFSPKRTRRKLIWNSWKNGAS